MVDGATLATLAIAALASLFMAWSIGAGSSGSTPFAPAVGANAISVMRAGFLVGLLGFTGAITQGAAVSEAVGRELVLGVDLTPLAATTGLLTAATLVAIGVYTGYPIATAFTVTGAIVGVGLALGGAPAWTKYQQIAALWLATPFVGGAIAYATSRLLRSETVSERVAIPLLGAVVGAILANVRFSFFGPGTSEASLAAWLVVRVPGPDLAVLVGTTLLLAVVVAALLAREMAADEVVGQRRFLLFLGGLVAFSAGGSQVGLAIGPLLPLFDPFAVPLVAILVGGGLGLLLGSWTGAPRMIKAIAQDYSSLGPRRSIGALIPSFVIAQVAILYGIPVSFNEIVVSAIVGSGFAAGSGGVSRRKMGYTALAWAGSLVLAVVVGYGVLWVVLVVG